MDWKTPTYSRMSKKNKSKKFFAQQFLFPFEEKIETPPSVDCKSSKEVVRTTNDIEQQFQEELDHLEEYITWWQSDN